MIMDIYCEDAQLNQLQAGTASGNISRLAQYKR